MYVLLVYDVGEKRVGKILKFLRKHLHWIQNSVFEGEITEAQLMKIENGVKKIIDFSSDSVIFFCSRDKKWLDKHIIGQEKQDTDNFI